MKRCVVQFIRDKSSNDSDLMNIAILKNVKFNFRTSGVCCLNTNDDQTFSQQDQASAGFQHMCTRIPSLFEIHDGVKAPGFN